MAFLSLDIPPGVVRPGTIYDARGRWYDANLVRWHQGVMQPIGGWEVLTGAGSADISGVPRKMMVWRRNNGDAKLLIGTNTKLYVYADGVANDVTPVGLTTGPASASGNFWSRTEAGVWQADTYGEDVVAVLNADGRIFYWDSSAGGAATQLANSPTNCVGVVVTPERFVFALGAGGDGRKVQWPDQDDNTDWTPSSEDQAGDQILPGEGAIMAGRRSRKETLIWTDRDLFSARYVGGNFIYTFAVVGSNCGAISRNAMAVVDGWAMWMGTRNFYLYDGSTRPIPSEVGDYVFNDIDRDQASKIWCEPRTDFNEIWWHYPSASGTGEIDRSVGVAYGGSRPYWMLGSGPLRTAGVDRGFLEYPIAADVDGATYWHEKGTTYADEGGSPTYTPYATSGPYEFGAGDRVMMVRQVIPDEDTLGEVQFELLTAMYPTASETTHGPFTAAEPTMVRATGRQVRVKVTQQSAGWRFGTPRLQVVPGGLR